MADPELSAPSLADLEFPVVLYSSRCIFALRRPGAPDLHLKPSPKDGDFLLADHSGRRYAVTSWKPGAPPSGVFWRFAALMGKRFFEPELVRRDVLSPRALAAELGEVAIRNELLGDAWGFSTTNFLSAIERVGDYDAAFEIAFSVSLSGPG